MNAAPVAPPPLLPEQIPPPERTLRRLFLTLFLRGRGARGLNKQGAPKSVGQKLALSLAFYFLFGWIALYFLHQPVFALAVYLHAMTFVFLGMFIASSAGEILFNKEEADILLLDAPTLGDFGLSLGIEDGIAARGRNLADERLKKVQMVLGIGAELVALDLSDTHDLAVECQWDHHQRPSGFFIRSVTDRPVASGKVQYGMPTVVRRNVANDDRFPSVDNVALKSLVLRGKREGR